MLATPASLPTSLANLFGINNSRAARRSAQQKAQERMDARMERKRKKAAGKFGPDKVTPYDGVLSIACEELGVVYRGIPAPQDTDLIRRMIATGGDITAERLLKMAGCPTSYEVMAKGN